MKKTDALIITDLQNDFCPGGTLAVKEGDRIVPGINRIIPFFSLIVATQDWHPADHCSFKKQGGPWPPHCVQDTRGAELHPDLDLSKVDLWIRKGQDPKHEAYSAFEQTPLEQELKSRGVCRVFIAGLTTDYCVKTTALDAQNAGFETVVLEDLIRAVNAVPGDGAKALEELRKAGVQIISSSNLK